MLGTIAEKNRTGQAGFGAFKRANIQGLQGLQPVNFGTTGAQRLLNGSPRTINKTAAKGSRV